MSMTSLLKTKLGVAGRCRWLRLQNIKKIFFKQFQDGPFWDLSYSLVQVQLSLASSINHIEFNVLFVLCVSTPNKA